MLAVRAEQSRPRIGIGIDRPEGLAQGLDESQAEEVVRRTADLNRGDELIIDAHMDVAEDPEIAHQLSRWVSRHEPSSARGSFGSPSTRSPMMPFWTSVEPA